MFPGKMTNRFQIGFIGREQFQVDLFPPGLLNQDIKGLGPGFNLFGRRGFVALRSRRKN